MRPHQRIADSGIASFTGYDFPAAVLTEVSEAVEQTLDHNPPDITVGYTDDGVFLYCAVSAIGNPDLHGPEWQFSLSDVLRAGLQWPDEQTDELIAHLRKAIDTLERERDSQRP